MRERSLNTAPADTPATTPTPTIRKRRCTSISLCPTLPTPRVTRKEFWTARMREIPSFRCNPWDFYEPFLILGSGSSVVLCNNGAEIRAMRTFGVASHDEEVYCFPEIQHPNFVNICERYLFKGKIFAFTEYIGFSIEDLLFHSIYPTEREIACIISQVLAGIQFIWSRKLDHPRISTENILVSSKGEVKIDPTIFPDDREHTSADLNSLGTIMLEMMDETRETLKSTVVDWSAEAVNFVEVTSSSTPDELSDHVFITRSRGAEILTPLCALAHFLVSKDVSIDGNAGRRLG